jgi:hypothetical protein
MALRKFPLDTNAFNGISGKKYIIENDVSTARYLVFERLQIESQWLISVSAFADEMEKVQNLLETPKVASASNLVVNIRNGVARIQRGDYSPLFYIASLFVIEEGEDVTQWSEASAMEKIKDWGDISASFFLNLAARFLTAYLQGLNLDFLTSLEIEAEEMSAEQMMSTKR